MRGKEATDKRESRVIRITPAYAGKSFKVKEFACKDGDHPRVCGEKYSVVSAQNVESGSPPRMRGKDPYGVHKAFSKRITPAYAGKRQER